MAFATEEDLAPPGPYLESLQRLMRRSLSLNISLKCPKLLTDQVNFANASAPRLPLAGASRTLGAMGSEPNR